jgi:hypothetical protein
MGVLGDGLRLLWRARHLERDLKRRRRALKRELRQVLLSSTWRVLRWSLRARRY